MGSEGSSLAAQTIYRFRHECKAHLSTFIARSARTCEIYLPNAHRPLQIDDEGTLTLGHELLHCMLGEYHP